MIDMQARPGRPCRIHRLAGAVSAESSPLQETVYHLCRSVACGELCDRHLLCSLPVLILPSLLTGFVGLSDLLPLFFSQRPRSIKLFACLLNLGFTSGFDLCDGCRNCHRGNLGGLRFGNYCAHHMLSNNLQMGMLEAISSA